MNEESVIFDNIGKMDVVDDKSTSLILSFKWTDEYTRSLIRTRIEKKDYFTGKRNAAKNGWDIVLMEMGLSGIISVKQAKKKWDNLVHKYKELKNAKIYTNDEEATAAWQFYQLMDEALGNGPLVTLPVVIASIMDVGEAGGSNVLTMPTDDSLLHEHLIQGNATFQASHQNESDQPARKKRKKESDDAYLELLRQTRDDCLRMHATLERQGERMISLFTDLVNSTRRN